MSTEIPYMMENTPEEFERVLDLAWPAPALTAEEAARVDGDDSREAPDAVLVDGDWISPSREAHARNLTKSWADAAQTAGCPTAFVARMRTFVEVHDRNHRTALAALAGQHTTDEEQQR